MRAPRHSIQRTAPVIAIVGTVLTILGLGTVFIEQGFYPLPRTIVIAGLATLALALALRMADLAAAVRGPGTIGRVATVAGAMGAVLALAAVNVQARRLDERWDVTRARQHTLAALTLASLGRLHTPVKITALIPGPPPDYIKDLFTEFERPAHGMLQTEIVDPLVNLGYAAQFGPKIDAKGRRVVVSTGPGVKPARSETIDCADHPLTQELLASAVIKVTAGLEPVYFLTGHGEYDTGSDKSDGLTHLAEAVTARGLKPQKLLLATQKEIPADARVLVVAGAKRTLDRTETDAIQRYLRGGGHALFLIESAIRVPDGQTPPAGENPDMNDILTEWGLAAGDDVVVDMVNHLGSDVGCPATNVYPPHEKIVADLGVTFFIRPRSISTLDTPGVMTANLVTTLSKDQSWAETDKHLHVHYDEGVDMPGPVPIGAVVMKTLPSSPAAPARATKVIAFGAASFVTNEFADRYSNIDLVANSIAWLAQPEPILAANAAKTGEEPKLAVTSRDQRLALVVTGMVPVLVMALGMVVSLRRQGLV